MGWQLLRRVCRSILCVCMYVRMYESELVLNDFQLHFHSGARDASNTNEDLYLCSELLV